MKRGIVGYVVCCVVAAGYLAADGPAPVNPYNGMQEREDVFAFTEKPKVAGGTSKEGTKTWTISFAVKAPCDVTVSILDKQGKVVRHLASGVLGTNAPWPFKQGTLSQKLEWDGLTDDFKAAPSGCRVRVRLGLKPEYERNIMPPPYNFLREPNNDTNLGACIRTAIDKDGNTCIAVVDSSLAFGQVYDKEGKYLRTFWPPRAEDVAKVGVPLTTTKWGEKTPWSGWFGPFVPHSRMKGVAPLDAMLGASGVDPKEFKQGGPWPSNLPQPTLKGGGSGSERHKANWEWFQKWGMFGVDAEQKIIYGRLQVGTPINEETGEFIREGKVVVGPKSPDGLYYSWGDWWHEAVATFMRRDITGKIIPFKYGSGPDGSLYNGYLGTSGGCATGFDVNETGNWAVEICGKWTNETDQKKIDKVHTLKNDMKWGAQRYKEYAAADIKLFPTEREFIAIFDRDGKSLTRSAVEYLGCTTDVFMDRDGNIYVSQGFILPAGQKVLHGIAECPGMPRGWGGSIIKFRDLGGKYPLGTMYGGRSGSTAPPPADALKLEGERTAAGGALWAYGGISNLSGHDCQCNLSGFHLDNWSRVWAPNNAVAGVMVVDTNGNFVMRVGKYGNVDDEGIRFTNIRSVWATDEALYVWDQGNARLSKILLKYHAEEETPLT